MTFSATISGGIATIVVNGIESTASLRVENAANLGNELLAFVSDPSTAPVDKTPSYQVYPTDKGLRITTTYGQIDLPWRWIHGIGTALNA